MNAYQSTWRVRVNNLTTLLTILALSFGCKKKNSQDGGLLEEPTKSGGASSNATSSSSSINSDAVSQGGDWRIVCTASDQKDDKRSYVIDLSGAVSETDENQPLKVSIHRRGADASLVELATGEAARGALAKTGNLFFGFAGGALTGQYQPSISRHEGLLTIVKDPEATGLNVLCDVTPTTPSLITPPQDKPVGP